MADAKPRGRERNREGEGNNKPRAKVESRRQMAATQSFFEKDMTVSTAPLHLTPSGQIKKEHVLF